MVRLSHPKALVTTLLHSTSGSVAAITGIMLTVLLGFIAFAVDLGRLTLVKGELQRAADAGALAGARALVPYDPGGGILDNDNNNSDQFRWDTGKTAAQKTILANKVEGVQLTDFDTNDIKAGWWDLKNKTWKDIYFTPAPEDRNSVVPGIWVTITKADGKNGGPVNFSFGSFVGKESANVTVEAIAALSGSPVAAAPGGVFPLAVLESKVKANWNKPNVTLSNHKQNEVQFTSFFSKNGNTPDLINYMNSGNPEQIKINDRINIVSGTKAALYNSSAAGVFVNKVVLIPVVDNVNYGAVSTVKGFVAFNIKSVDKKIKSISGNFVTNYVAPGTQTGNTNNTDQFYGTWASSAKLIQ